eukprot:1196278-Prorocentrum_minimum.AAC.7
MTTPGHSRRTTPAATPRVRSAVASARRHRLPPSEEETRPGVLGLDLPEGEKEIPPQTPPEIRPASRQPWESEEVGVADRRGSVPVDEDQLVAPYQVSDSPPRPRIHLPDCEFASDGHTSHTGCLTLTLTL